MDEINYSSNINVFLKKDKKNKIFKQIIYLTLAGFFISLSLRYFILFTNIFSPGLAGLSQGITYTMYISLADSTGHVFGMNQVVFENVFYWVFYISFNIPVIIFTFLRYGKKFLLMSLYVLCSSAIFSMIFTFLPAFSGGYFNPNDLEEASTVVQFSTYIILAAIGGIIYGIGVGIAFYQGYCSMGLDPISRYYSREKGIKLFKTLFTFSIINSVIWIFVGELIIGNINDVGSFFQATIFNLRILSSLIFLGVYTLILDIVYPTDQKLLIEINTNEDKAITEILDKINYHRGYSLTEIRGGYLKELRYKIQIIINREEKNDLLSYIYEGDNKAFVNIIQIKDVITPNQSISWSPKLDSDEKIKEQISKTKKKLYKLFFWWKSGNNLEEDDNNEEKNIVNKNSKSATITNSKEKTKPNGSKKNKNPVAKTNLDTKDLTKKSNSKK